jgi:hypothetical protein
MVRRPAYEVPVRMLVTLMGALLLGMRLTETKALDG